MTRRSAFSSAPALHLADASTLARGTAPTGATTPVALRKRATTSPAARLQELQGLDVDEVLVLAHDVGIPHRFEELPGALEVPQADLDAAEALGDVAVGAGAGDDRVLAGEANGLLVEGGERHPRVEHLEDVDLIDHL